MACGSGCCGPPKQPIKAVEPPKSDIEKKDSHCEEDCCFLDESVKDTTSEPTSRNCCDGEAVQQDSCCKPTKKSPNGVKNDSCKNDSCTNEVNVSQADEGCGPQPVAHPTCSTGCCSTVKEKHPDTSDAIRKEEAPALKDKVCGKICCSKKPPPLPVAPVLDDCCTPKPAKPACQEGCCSTTKKAPAPRDSDICVQSSAEVNRNKGCCENDGPRPTKTAGGQKDDCRSSPLAKKGCRKASCSKTASKPPNPPDVLSPTEKSCAQGCCSKPVPRPSNSPEALLCCAGKPTPCCDDSCIERLALRECKSGESASSSSEAEDVKSSILPTCHQGKNGRACSEHAQKARQHYQSRLEALGCICRALIALGQETCCAPQRPPTKRNRSLRTSSSTASTDSCCGPRLAACGSTAKILCQSGSSCADGCCGGPESKEIIETIEVIPKAERPIDLEKGTVGREHVILSISGMTCTGCETKLKRTLGTLDSISNLKTSLVLARAEFDLDSRMGSAEDVIKHLERTTEFKCERVTNQGSSLDLLCSADPLSFVKGQWPDGVTDIRLVDRRTIRVDYDAKVIGARELTEKGWEKPMHLAPPRPDPTLDAGSRHVRHLGFMAVLSAILTIPVLVMAWSPLPKKEITYGSASLALATIVQVVVAGPFYPKATKDLIFSRTVEVDLLIVLSTSAAYVFSVVSFGYLVAGKPLSTGEFFETSTLLVTIIMIGRFISALARQKAAESISIRSLQTSAAILIDEEGGEKEIDARLLQYGDVFKIIPDCRIPTDGTVISGSSEVDESMITGEAMPIEKNPKSTLIAGSINGPGTLVVRLTRLPGDNTISTIASMVDEAKLSKPKIQDIADHVAGYFVPVIIALTIITFVIWIAVGVAVRNQSGSEATVQALTYAITVLIVSCPCAIGLAVPMVVVIASGVAAQRGVIFKSANSIEIAYKTTDVVFDKTGSLTRGELSVSHEEYLVDDVDAAKSMLLGLVGSIKHPVSAAVTAYLKAGGTPAASVLDPKSLAGKGVEGNISSKTLRAGNSRWLGCSSNPQARAILSQGLTTFCFTIDGTLAAVYGLQDSLRSDAQPTISALHESGISVHILSGDDDGAVHSVATQLKIPDTQTRSRCSPADKQAYIQTLLEPRLPNGGHKTKNPVIIFVGDGTNDAVALAQATIGVHISTGTDVAKSAADVVLMRPSLSGILTMIAISKKAIHRIAFNFVWSFVYNLFAVLLGAGAFVHARIPPEFAGLGELVSVLPVIGIAVALRLAKV